MNDYLKQLNEAETTVTITPTPLILNNVGDKFRGMYIGIQPFDKNGKMLTVAHFYDGTGIVFNMGAQLTRAVSVLKPGTSVEIKLIELKPVKNSDGKTKIYSVTPLNIPRQNIEEMFGGVLSIEAPAPEHLLPAPTVIDNGEVDELEAAGIPRKTQHADPVTAFWATVKEINMSKDDAKAMLANCNGNFELALSMLDGK